MLGAPTSPADAPRLRVRDRACTPVCGTTAQVTLAAISA
ncbi:hypothetical protein SERN_0309 [Serinibacter arcticus]|uniref:Uncharacterized protein n=1 Tax=Serinibacter arcticus TaxID=1655435 RepID=A0A4Z1E990_9MICO|nr:hypothetical protein SERN_0309 [Serinibacter arcticus]